MAGARPPGLAASATFLHRGLPVAFEDLTYRVTAKGAPGGLAILEGATAALGAGELVALMGPSGSGKTTLLDALSGRARATGGQLSGRVRYGGAEPSRRFLRRFVGYVTQFDTLVPILTVEEMLAYTAELKLPVALAKADKAAAVEGVIRALGLESCRSVLIGTAAARGVSGGQAKRVNIGIALVSNPRVLFLDEPTTGLDSFTQNEVMQVVASLARGGITVCCTIHSPTATVFALFDRLVLLLEGKCVYTGKAGEAAVRYLCALPKPPPAPAPGASHAEWITDFTVSASRAARGPELAAAYVSSGAAKEAAAETAALMALEAGALDSGSAAALKTRSQTATPMWHAIATLARYRMRKNYASGSFLGARIGTWFFQTFVLATTFWAVAEDISNETVTNVSGIIFFWCAAPVFGAAAYVPEIMMGRPLYRREIADGLYTPLTYVLYLIIEELTIMLPIILLANTVMWFCMRLAGSFVLWWISQYVSVCMGIILSYAICSWCSSIDVANAAVPVVGVFALFFSGVLKRTADIGWWWRWMVYATPTYWAVAAQIRNVFAGERDVVFVEGLTVTEYYDVGWLTAWEFFGVQFVFPALFLILAWLGLRRV